MITNVNGIEAEASINEGKGSYGCAVDYYEYFTFTSSVKIPSHFF